MLNVTYDALCHLLNSPFGLEGVSSHCTVIVTFRGKAVALHFQIMKTFQVGGCCVLRILGKLHFLSVINFVREKGKLVSTE